MVTVGISVMIIIRFIVALPATFVALTVKLYLSADVGMPVIATVDAFKFKPTGSEPPDIDQVIGVVPVAASLWL